MFMRRKISLPFLVSAVFILLNLMAGPLYGVDTVDNLRLTGIVKSVDLNSGLIVLDVKSQSCLGKRTFRFDTDKEKLSSGITGKKIRFMIDSSICGKGVTHEIISFIRK